VRRQRGVESRRGFVRDESRRIQTATPPRLDILHGTTHVADVGRDDDLDGTFEDERRAASGSVSEVESEMWNGGQALTFSHGLVA
jgi:hypothetical protein